MLRYIIKVAISATLLVIVSEVSKKTSFWGGLIASLPITSLLALIWLYFDTKNEKKVAELSMNIFWFVLPSLLFFVTLPVFINKLGLNTYLSLFLSALITMFGYWITSIILSKFGIKV
ncbi:MAG TPA: DUF3147 family protein [Thermotogota bacterium]|nr:DUF3147 family protein [Thermotogota bacterium]